MSERVRVREWGIEIGRLTPGPMNAITDVAGVRVGHCGVVHGDGALVKGKGPARTGVTAIWPAEGHLFESKVPTAVHVINGFGKSVGLMQIEEVGHLETPILITNTLNVGLCADHLIEYLLFQENWDSVSINPVVMECNDSHLNDIAGRHVKREHAVEALAAGVTSGPVQEGAVGAGTGMSCYGFKGGIGTASRLVEIDGKTSCVLGCLVCSNMGRREDLRVDGFPVGRALAEQGDPPPEFGSIIILLATDAPLESHRLRRVARRATHGLARTGTCSGPGSGDVVLAWSTGFRIPLEGEGAITSVPRLSDAHMATLFRAAADCTEEAILNSLWMAETTIGRDGNTREEIPLDRVRELLRQGGYRLKRASPPPG